MKITNPTVEVIAPMPPDAILAHIERCARICYQSDTGDAEKLVRRLIRDGHESTIEHINITAIIVTDRGVTHELVRHRLASYCVTGDTVLRSMTQKSWTVGELYKWQSDHRRRGRIRLINLRSMDERTRTIVPNKIEKIHYVGTKPVFLLVTESGRQIKCTADHKIATPEGYVELQGLKAGDEVLSNGKELLDNPDWIRWYYIEENHTRKETAAAIGCSEATLYKAFKRHGIKKPWSDRPNRVPGHGVKGMFSEAAIQRLRESKLGKNNPSYRADRASLSLSGAYGDAHRSVTKEKCEFCGATKGLEIHHIDKRPHNNSPENVKVLCARCHHLWHKPGAVGVFADKIVSIEPAGSEDVYDVTMAAPFHNFVANGIVVHNCQESTRYCNYGKDKFGNEIAVICPPGLDDPDAYAVWDDAMRHAEAAYMRLLRNGVPPEIARSVLPTGLKTQIAMTCNLREWRHFVKLRALGHHGKPHPQIREIALMILERLYEAVPVVFDDLWEEAHECTPRN